MNSIPRFPVILLKMSLKVLLINIARFLVMGFQPGLTFYNWSVIKEFDELLLSCQIQLVSCHVLNCVQPVIWIFRVMNSFLQSSYWDFVICILIHVPCHDHQIILWAQLSFLWSQLHYYVMITRWFGDHHLLWSPDYQVLTTYLVVITRWCSDHQPSGDLENISGEHQMMWWSQLMLLWSPNHPILMT